MKINENTLLKNIFLTLTLTLIVFIILYSNLGGNLTQLNIILFFAIMIISILFISLSKYSYSLESMHWIFILFFFSISPLLQYSNGFYSWGYYVNQEEIKMGCFFIILWLIFYKIGQLIFIKKKLELKFNEKKIADLSSFSCFILTFLGILLALIYIRNIGFSNLFARSTSALKFEGDLSKAKGLLLSNIAISLLVFNTSIGIKNYQINKNKIIFIIINLFLLMLVCFPTGTSRNNAGTVYFGLIILFFNRKKFFLIKSNFYIISFIIGFLILFPALNSFRNSNFFEINILQVLKNVIFKIKSEYLSENYDAFSMIVITSIFIKLTGITNGSQLFSSILFFVPRVLWKNKSIGSGSLIFTKLGKSFTNVSSPLIAEGLINFGIAGLIFFAITLGFFTKKIDYYYWKNMQLKEANISYIEIIYPYLLTLFFFMMRGDLMSTWSKTFTYIVVFYLLYQFLFFTQKIRIRLRRKI